MSAMNMQGTLPDADRIVAEAETAVAAIKSVRAAIGHVIYGQETVIENGGTGEDVTLLGACALLLTRELGLTVHR